MVCVWCVGWWMFFVVYVFCNVGVYLVGLFYFLIGFFWWVYWNEYIDGDGWLLLVWWSGVFGDLIFWLGCCFVFFWVCVVWVINCCWGWSLIWVLVCLFCCGIFWCLFSWLRWGWDLLWVCWFLYCWVDFWRLSVGYCGLIIWWWFICIWRCWYFDLVCFWGLWIVWRICFWVCWDWSCVWWCCCLWGEDSLGEWICDVGLC